jgi:hypothetical protein
MGAGRLTGKETIMHSSRPVSSLLIALLAVAIPCAALADEAATAGRQILEAHKNSVITVRLVINQKFSMPGMGSQEQETRSEGTGTVLDETGLTVMSLSSTDPSQVLRSMMGSSEGFSSTLSDVQILLDSGKEIPAQVVLRDADLDLAFLRPTEPVDEPFTPVDTSRIGEPVILDQLIALNRLGRVANRAYAASVERVESVVTRPRTLYVPGQGDTSAGLGSPCFTLDGDFVGVGVVRTVRSGSGGMMSMLTGGDRPMAVIIPAADILDTAQQAPEVDAAKGAGGEEEEADSEEEETDSEPAPAEEG